MGSNRRRRRVEPTEDWEQIELLCAWPEQTDYELIRPSVLFPRPPRRQHALQQTLFPYAEAL